MEWDEKLTWELKKPFPEASVKWRAGPVTKKSPHKAMALAFINARDVMKRLDDTVGPGGWEDDYEVISTATYVAKCRLTVLGVTKSDVGDCSAASGGSGDNDAKAAFSDALKRAAVKFGIGRYLYYLPSQWVPYDTERKHFTAQPTLPDWARAPHIGEETGTMPETEPDPTPPPEEPKQKIEGKVGRNVSEIIGTKEKRGNGEEHKPPSFDWRVLQAVVDAGHATGRPHAAQRLAKSQVLTSDSALDLVVLWASLYASAREAENEPEESAAIADATIEEAWAKHLEQAATGARA